MLFDGAAIFGAVGFSERSQTAQRDAEQLSRRAVQLGARSGYASFGCAALGWVDRKPQCGTANDRRRKSKLPIAVAGEILSRLPMAGNVERAGESYDWILADRAAGGSEFLKTLDGTFSLAFWHERGAQLTLMTDRSGDGQLFYRKEANGLLFSSWLRLLAGPECDLDRQSVQEFLRFFYITPPRSIYKGISRIEPGHYLTVANGALAIHALESIHTNDIESASMDGADATLQQFQNLFEASIERRIGSRRVGVFLSSGVDSATLMAGCQRIVADQVEAFTVGFDAPELDESAAARAYADCLGVPHTTLRFNLSDYHAAFEKNAREFDQPFADPATLPLTCAAGAAKESVEVLTDGSGSDGLFGAPIPRHLRFPLEFSDRFPVALRKFIGAGLSRVEFLGLASHAALFDFDEVEELFITWPGWSKSNLAELLGAPVSFQESGFYRAFRARRNSGAQQVFEAVAIYPPDDARFEAAALANIAMTLPYHDAELRRFVRRQPQSLRFHDGATKILLQQLFGKYFPAPRQALKKRYFNFPLQSFLAKGDYALVRRHLSVECLSRHGVVDPKQAGVWIDRYLAGDPSVLFKVWSLLVLHAWLDSRN
jgi:asparagine synthase (glutamine-hydrolysing)